MLLTGGDVLCNEYISDSSNIWPSVAFLSPWCQVPQLVGDTMVVWAAPRLPSSQSLIPPLPSLISSSQPFIVKNINKCRENIDKRTVFCMLVLLLSSDVWWEITVRNIIFTQYLCKPNVSPVQQIRSKNKYFVFYWQTQVFDEEKVNHWIWTISCKNICFDPCSNFVVEGK